MGVDPLGHRGARRAPSRLVLASPPQCLRPPRRSAPRCCRSTWSRGRSARSPLLSLPWELRGLAAIKPGVIGAMDRIFAEEIARLTRRLAGIDGAQTGSVGCPQMFG